MINGLHLYRAKDLYTADLHPHTHSYIHTQIVTSHLHVFIVVCDWGWNLSPCDACMDHDVHTAESSISHYRIMYCNSLLTTEEGIGLPVSMETFDCIEGRSRERKVRNQDSLCFSSRADERSTVTKVQSLITVTVAFNMLFCQSQAVFFFFFFLLEFMSIYINASSHEYIMNI